MNERRRSRLNGNEILQSMKRIELIATAILTVLSGGTYSSRAQNATVIAQQAYIKASNTGANDWFGVAIAISGDTMTMGASFESSNATGVNGKPFRTRTACGFALLALVLNLLFICLAAATTFSDANWSSMNPSIPGADGAIYAAVVDGAGNLYVAGDFTAIGEVIANNIAKWNGTNWSALASGINFPVFALAVSGTDVYAGGSFSTAGGVAAANIAKWSGSNWSALGLGVYGINTEDGPIVYALAVSGNDLYVGGLFTTAGDVAATNTAKWNGSNWSALGPGLQELGCCGNGFGVFTLAASGHDLYAGGYFLVSTADGTALANVAKWNGTNWSALAWGPVGGPVRRHAVKALALSGNDLYASDDYGMVAKWNGTSWSTLGSGMNSPVAALAVSGSDLYAGGSFTTAGGIQANSIAKWNGSSWTALGSGVNGKVQALTVSGSDLYVGGHFTTAGGKVSTYIARAYLLDLPALSVRRSGTEVEVSWPSADTTGFALEQASTLTTPGSWVANTASVADDGTTKSVSLPAASNAQFFRLRRP